MKLLTHNIYQGGRDQITNLFQFWQKQNPDIIAIQEACAWYHSQTHLKLAETLQISKDQIIYGHANSGRSREDRVYDLILASRYPILESKIFNDPSIIWHALILAILKHPELGKICVANIHLSSKSEEWRLKEIDNLLQKLKKYKDLPTFLVGDLNSLSPNDPYPKTLAHELTSHGISKFGNPPKFDVIQKLFDAGFKDHMAFDYTVWSESDDPDHLNLRLDYILTKNIDKEKIGLLRVLNTAETKIVSDHLPVTLTL